MTKLFVTIAALIIFFPPLSGSTANAQISGKYYDIEFSKDPDSIASACKTGSDTIVEFIPKSIEFHENSCAINKVEPWPQSKTIFDYFVKCIGGNRKTRLIIEKQLNDRIWVQWDDKGPKSKTDGTIYQKCPVIEATSQSAGLPSPPSSQSTANVSAGKRATEPQYALVEPDKQFGAIGDWKVSTARFGVGCLAVYGYDDTSNITIGGETPKKLAVVVETARKLFAANLDAEPYVEGVELVLGSWRRGDLAPYGYRGTAGVVAPFDRALSQAFLEAPSIKLTERGSVKLVVPLRQTKEMMAMLIDCFGKTR